MVGAFCGGIASATTSSAPTLLSALWFPASERTTATAIVTNGATAGAALSFITGISLISAPSSGEEIPPIINSKSPS